MWPATTFGYAWLNEVPWLLAGLTVGLFLLTTFASKMTKRWVRKRAEGVKTSGFWAEFFRCEQGFIVKLVAWIYWVLFFAASIYIWMAHIGLMLSRLNLFYAPFGKALVIVVIAIMTLKALRIVIHVFVERGKSLAENSPRGVLRIQTLEHIFKYLSTAVVTFVTALMLLNNFGINLGAVLATVGVASVALGFGAQSLVKDVLSGIFILSEDQYAVGDVVVINGEGGLVERMTLRITQLRNTEGTLVTVPNGSVANVKNMTSEWSRVDYKIGVAYQTDLDRAMDLLLDEAKKLSIDMPDLVIEEPEPIGVDEFMDSSVVLRIWIKTKPLMQWKVRREYNKRIHKRFSAEGIEIPFPQRALWIRESKDASLPGAMVKS